MKNGNDDFRVTFESNILARDKELDLSKGSYGVNILDKNLYVLEIKTLGVIPMWFVEILSSYKLQPGHFSKYGVAYENLILGKELKTVEELVSKTEVKKNNYEYSVDKIYSMA